MNQIREEQKLINLEYNLISDFIKLRNELGLTQKKWVKHQILLDK